MQLQLKLFDPAFGWLSRGLVVNVGLKKISIYEDFTLPNKFFTIYYKMHYNITIYKFFTVLGHNELLGRGDEKMKNNNTVNDKRNWVNKNAQKWS